MKFIQDDCALESEDKAVGRRGLLGGIATLKGIYHGPNLPRYKFTAVQNRKSSYFERECFCLVLSAAAEEGKSLSELDQVFDSVTAPDNLGTIGFSTSGCSLPVGKPGKSSYNRLYNRT